MLPEEDLIGQIAQGVIKEKNYYVCLYDSTIGEIDGEVMHKSLSKKEHDYVVNIDEIKEFQLDLWVLNSIEGKTSYSLVQSFIFIPRKP